MNGISNMNHCMFCNQKDVENDDAHEVSLGHRFNFLLFSWNNYRKALMKNREGIEIDVEPVRKFPQGFSYDSNHKSGKHIIKLTPAQFEKHTEGIKYSFVIKNAHKENNILLVSAFLLHPKSSFELVDPQTNLHQGKYLELEPNAKYEIFVEFNLPTATPGIFDMPIAFTFQTLTKPVKEFTIARHMVIDIGDHESDLLLNIPEKSPFTSVVWPKLHMILPPVKQNKCSNMFPIPEDYNNALKVGLKEFKGMEAVDYQHLQIIKQRLQPEYPTADNYRNYFHVILWLDEVGASVMLTRYNMENVTMVLLKEGILELEVPGLAEKRPSLIIGDSVLIRLHEDHTAYTGIVRKVNDTTIHIYDVNQELREQIEISPEIELDVSFVLSRLCYERMHQAVNNCIGKGFLPILFPHSSIAYNSVTQIQKINPAEFVNQMILHNAEQRIAVTKIINRTSQSAPYIVFGPPGTGKTVTIVEAIHQIKNRFKNAKILVCAPSNSACDMLASKLVENCSRSELIRIHSDNRDWNTVPQEVKAYSNHNGVAYTRITGNDIIDYRIVVTTLILCGKYYGKFNADFVFIDEAAQALEPEAAIAISLMKRQDSQVVLAGDPKQLGPICSSTVAEKYKLGISLLERLMSECSLYQNGNTNFITMLKLNFRTHPTILKLPNSLFYENQLEPKSEAALLDPIARVFIGKLAFPVTGKKKTNIQEFSGQPVEFWCVNSKEKREGKSPSYFNDKEVQHVVKCVTTLMNLSHKYSVKPTDIGIITPYIRQVYRIKEKLRYLKCTDIEVGTTEAFQGREKRIILISTVRAQHSLLLHDRRYNLGFVKHEKRFNVAITRAKSKLIVIGNPLVLGTDQKWLQYIELCEKLHGYFGPAYERRDNALKQEIIKRLHNVRHN